MNFSKDFFEDEVRDGFYVPARVKQSWAISMEVTSEIDKICKKHSIKYFADYGTFLGAVRHGGPIPWDDDFDLCMLRKDYERFLEVAPNELPQDYAIENLRNHEDNWDFNFFLARVINKNRICFEKEHLQKYHGFPYMTGVDIFVIDNVSDDSEKEEERIKEAFDYLARAELAKKKDNDKEGENYWLLETEKEFAKFDSEDTEYVSEMIQFGLHKQRYFRAEQYKETFWLPFENMKIPVPGDYLSMLRVKYGDYLKPAPDTCGHEYPFFEGQQAQLEDTMGFKMPSYSFSEEELIREKPSKEYGRKNEAKQYLEYLVNLSKDAKERLASENINDFREALAECQKFAIDFGTWIEKVFYEGYITVSHLENFCEQVALAYENVTFDGLEESIDTISKSVEKDILNRNEVVFIPYKARYWDFFEQEYKKASADENTDVYVVPVPYFYKDWDGTLKDMQYDLSEYPTDINVISYDSFDFELHQPDVIYIQNPYDEWNDETSIHPDFYSKKLQKYTNKLIYIPWFETAEFSKYDERAYHNMKYYCTMPGVIHADEVIVQSENIRELYIDRLCDFAGEITRSIWDKKICNKEERESTEIEATFSKKRILFTVSLTTALYHEKEFFNKLEKTLDTFRDYSDKVILLWNKYTEDYEITDEHQRINDRLNDVFEKYCKDGWGEYSESNDILSLVKRSNAYYGIAAKEAYYCFRSGMAVMVTSIDT